MTIKTETIICPCGKAFERKRVGPETAFCPDCRGVNSRERNRKYTKQLRSKRCECGREYQGNYNAVRCDECKAQRRKQKRKEQYIRNVKGRVSRYRKSGHIEFTNDPNMANGIYC